MHIVGIDSTQREENQVHTIDIWFSRRRGAWMVERLDAEGEPLGGAHQCRDEENAMDCLAEWLHAHPETVLVAPRNLDVAKASIKRISRRAA